MILNNATPSNCGNILKSCSTTSSEKSDEGTQVMPESNSNNEQELDNLQQVY